MSKYSALLAQDMPILSDQRFPILIDMYKVALIAMDMLVKLMDGEYYLPRIKIESNYIELDSTK